MHQFPFSHISHTKYHFFFITYYTSAFNCIDLFATQKQQFVYNKKSFNQNNTYI